MGEIGEEAEKLVVQTEQANEHFLGDPGGARRFERQFGEEGFLDLGQPTVPVVVLRERNLAEFDQERLDAYSLLGGSSPDLGDKLVRDHHVLLSRALLARWSAAKTALSRESMA